MYGSIFTLTSPTIAFHNPWNRQAPASSGDTWLLRDIHPPSSLAGNILASPAMETLERPSFDVSEKIDSDNSVLPLLDFGGGDDDHGGDGIRIGGGQAGRDNDDEGSDDDKRRDGDDNGGGDEKPLIFRRRRLVVEVFDREIIEAVLSEWMRKMKNFPLSINRACEIGILSSVELSKFLWFDLCRSVSQLIYGIVPGGLIMELTGKVMADPSLPYKLGFEAISSVCWSGCVDSCSRKTQRNKKDWDLMVTNAVINAICNVFAVWSLAPSNELISLPKLSYNVNNVFEMSQRGRNLGFERRLVCFFRKAGDFFALGFASKFAAGIPLSRDEFSTESLARLIKESFAAGMSFGLFSNLRYQLIWGIDRSLDLYFDVNNASHASSLALRFLNIGCGTLTLNWAGFENQENCPNMVDSSIPHVGDGFRCADYGWFGLRNVIATRFSLRKKRG